MAQYVTPAQLSGLFKEVYGDDIKQLVPEVAKVVKMVKFAEEEKQEGNKYHQPVIVSNEKGMTYAAAQAGAFSLNNSISMTMKDAQVEASQMLLRSAMSYDTAAKASKAGARSFQKATQLLVENMMETMMKRLELGILYGGSAEGIGRVSSSVNSSATKTVLQLTTASWATGIWAGEEDATLNFYKVSDDTLVSSGADSIFTIESVDIDNKKLTVTGTATGISALDTAAGAGNLYIHFNGAKSNEMNGFDKIITNSGTLFNISAATYSLWKGNTHSAGSAALTMGKVLNAVSKAVQRGLNEKITLLVNPDTWSNVNTDLAALRRFDGSYRREKGENGVENICFYGQNGEIELVPHNCVKMGEAFGLPMKRVKRLGAQDVSFKTPGREDEIFLHLASNAGFELRLYTDQCVFIETPARCVKITNIVNS